MSRKLLVYDLPIDYVDGTIVGGKGVTVTHMGDGRVLIEANYSRPESVHSTADLDMRDRFSPAAETGFVVGEEVEWSPDLQQTWRYGVIREVDLPNARITVQQGNTVYAIAYRDVRRPSATIGGGECGDQTSVIRDSGPSGSVAENCDQPIIIE